MVQVAPALPQISHSPKDAAACDMCRSLPEPLMERAQRASHLWEHLHTLDVKEIVVPDFAPTLGRRHRRLDHPNVIYPLGKYIFIHVLLNPESGRNHYIVIEPAIPGDDEKLIRQVDARLATYADILVHAKNQEERLKIMLDLFDKICRVGNNGWIGSRLFSHDEAIEVSEEHLDALKYRFLRDKAGLGRVEPLVNDPYIEDISCSGIGPLFIEHKVFGSLISSVSFDTSEDLDTYAQKLSEKIGRPITLQEPILDAVLPDGSRINIVYGTEVSQRGSNFSIRKFSATPLSILGLIEFGSLSHEMAVYFSFVMREGMNVFVCGEAASGKTTLLNAMACFIEPASKIVSIEDTPELQVPHTNWIRETVRGTGSRGGSTDVTMMDLLKAALRQRPNNIIIGEIRGEEGAIAFQAMQTGHACMSTFHASSVDKLIQRLTGAPINIPKTYVDNLNVAIIAGMVRLMDGSTARRVINVNEITGYDTETDSFAFVEVFRWNPVTDTHEFVGRNNSFLLEQRIAPKRGFLPNERRAIYAELQQRASTLKNLHEHGVSGFFEVYQTLTKAYREGLFK